MANYIPKLVFAPNNPATVVFDTPPEGDPFGEAIGTEKEQVRSVGGQLFTSEFYDYTTFTLRFILQSNAVAVRLKSLFKNLGLKGETFLYYPHSDDDTIVYGVELNSESVNFNRDHPDGQGGFLWSFEFELINVTKLRPRIVRTSRSPGPQTRAPGPVVNLRTISVDSTFARIAWEQPTDSGTSPLQSFETKLGENGDISTIVDIMQEMETMPPNLNAGTMYEYFVRAVNTENLKGPWESVEFTTTAAVQALSAVRNLRATDIQHNQITIEWDEPLHNGGSDIEHYQTKITAPIVVPSVGSFSTSTKRYTFRNLSANNTYTFSVRAWNGTVAGTDATLQVTTSAAPPPPAPQAPTDVKLMLGGVAENSRTLFVTFDWPTGVGSDSVTGFKVYCAPRGSSAATFASSVRRIAATGQASRNDYTVATSVTVPVRRPRAVTYEAYVVAINSSGDSEHSARASVTVPRTYRFDLHRNRRDDDDDYVYTDDFGDYNSSFDGLTFDLSDSTNWEAGRRSNYPRYAFANRDFAPLGISAMELSLTDATEMCIAAQITRRESSTVEKRILLLERRGGLAPFTFTPKRFIAPTADETTFVNAMTSFQATHTSGVSYTRYVWSTNGHNAILASRFGFPNAVDFLLYMNHASSISEFQTQGLCAIGRYLYVLDRNRTTIFCYDIISGSRVTSREFSIPSGNLWHAMWSNGVNIWIIGEPTSNRRSSNVKVYCYDVSTEARDNSKEFNIMNAHTFYNGNYDIGGLVALQDHFVLNRSSLSTIFELRAYKI